MNRILQFLPYHKKEISTLEQLSQLVVTTEVPAAQPETPKELKKLLKQYGLLDTEGKPVEIAPLPLAIVASDPKSTLRFGESSLPALDIRGVKPISVIKPEDYVNFKPLKPLKQANATSSADIESILKHFGLANSDKNSAKKVKITKPPSDDSSYHQMISSYSGLLENMGIPVPAKSKTPSRGTSNSNRVKTKNTDDYKNLQHLLDTIKELEKLNTTLTAKEVEKLNLKNFNFSESLLKNGPDPVLYQNHFSALKNEVKRRQSSFDGKESTPLLESSLEANEEDIGDELPSSTVRTAPKTTTARATTTTRRTTTSTTTERTTTTTEADEVESSTQERKNTLEDELDPVDDPAPLPPPRRSGFYMLVDWNSFFEVGEDENKIKVRFDPKIGDPSRFLPVTIP